MMRAVYTCDWCGVETTRFERWNLPSSSELRDAKALTGMCDLCEPCAIHAGRVLESAKLARAAK